jgi:hypothetical protein
MRRFLRHRPQPATVIALIALVVAMGGTGYAAITLPKNSVGSKQLKKGSVTNAKLASNAVTTGKVKNGSLLKDDFAAGQLPAGPAGAPGSKGDKGDKGDAGAKGDTGATGVVSTAEWTGLVGGIPGGTNNYVFAGPTGTVTTTATQRVTASASAAMGAASGTESTTLALCKQPDAGGALSELGGVDHFQAAVAMDTPERVYSESQSGVPGAGTWKIGLCIQNPGATAITHNDYSIGWAIVTN